MSRVGNKPITVPQGVTVIITDREVKVTGPKGSLDINIPRPITVKQEDLVLSFSRPNDEPANRALHGLARNLVNNAVIGVVEGFEKKLQLVGTGYRVATHPDGITLSLGFSHPVIFKKTPGIDLKIEGNDKITITGIDKHLVGQVAANIRSLRPPEPYKGKGVRYQDEVVRRKAGKTAKAGA